MTPAVCLCARLCMREWGSTEAAAMLRKRYFGGGTVAAVVSEAPLHELRADLAARWEDGTLPFAAISALLPSLQWIRGIGMATIER